MPILEADELAQLRADVREMLEETAPDRCDISRIGARTRSAAAPEQFTRGVATIAEDVPCSYKVSNSQERFLAGKSGDLNLWTVDSIPAGVDVRADDLLTIRAKGDDSAKTLIVATVLRASNAVKLKVLCTDK